MTHCLPPELCLSIFEYATWVENVTEPDPLDMNFQLFITANYQGSLKRSLRAKLSLIRVCKKWMTIGTPLLYENIVIGRGRYLPTIFTVLDASRRLGEIPSLGYWTKRLDIALRDSSRPVDDELASLAHIIQCLPNLGVVTFSVSSMQYAHEDISPCIILQALASTCAPSLKYLHWFRDTLIPDPQDIRALLHTSPNLRSFRSPLVAVKEYECCNEEFLHTSITAFHAEPSIPGGLDSPIPPQLVNLPALRQLSFVAPLFVPDARWATFLAKHGHNLQHIQALVYAAGCHLQPDLARIATSCPNLARVDLVFSHWAHMPFPVALPSTVQHLGIFCAQAQVQSYQMFFARLDNIVHGTNLRRIQFLGKRNVMDIFDKHSYQFWAGTERLRSNRIKFLDHRGVLIG